MAKNLVIVESPTKAKTIKKMLGSNYKVVASVGHIRDLPKSTLGIDIENDFEPKYINIRGKGDLIKELKKEAKKADKIFLATDPDREGEAISWHLSHILQLDPNDQIRVEFNEITKNTVKTQIKNPRSINMNLVDAQQARRVLDRLVGYKISPLLWKKVKNGLSAGRVQSVAVKLICDREEEIQNFIPEEYWTISAKLTKSRKTFNAEYYGREEDGKEIKRNLKNKEESDEVLNKMDKENFLVKNIKKGKKRRNPAPPFTTSTMQQDASRKIGFNTRKTMSVAQNLYEGIDIPGEGSVGLITYMRTDSTRISAEAKQLAKEYIVNNFGPEYSNESKVYNRKKDAQDAHECIRPTDVTKSPSKIKASLTRDEFRLYNLIWERFVASQMAAAVYDTMSISFDSNGEIFKSSGSIVSFDGFTKIYKNKEEKDELLPELKEGEKVKVKEVDGVQHFTQPPARYNEASLIKLMEELGIGRPSTYAPTISTIQSRYYVVLEEKRFNPTELGETVNELLTEYFSDLLNERFTAEMENDLDEIAQGNLQWKKIVAKVYDTLKEDLVVAEKAIEKVEIRDEETDVICEQCGKNMVIKMGRYGKFLACPGFPECRNTKPLIEEIGVPCPDCEDGKIVVKRSKKGKKFFGCSNYPSCEFVSWNEPINEKCPECGSILTKKETKRATVVRCVNSECKYSRFDKT